MPRQQGYYSLVQFCPDAARAEVANVGVLLFSPEHKFIDVLLSTTIRHVERVFHGFEFDAKQVDMMKKWVGDRVASQRTSFRTVEDLNRFISTRFNEMVLTAPRSIAVEEPAKQLEALYHELVEAPRHAHEKLALPFPNVDEFFKMPEIQGFVEFDKKITIPRWNTQLEIPYVFTNGKVYNVKPQWFASVEAAAHLVVEGQLLARHASANDKRQELHILPKVKENSRDPDLADKVLGVLNDLQGNGVHVVQATEIPQFLQELKQKVA